MEDAAPDDVFDRRGLLVKRVRLPTGTRLLGFGRGTIYLARTDADDLQYLKRYRGGAAPRQPFPPPGSLIFMVMPQLVESPPPESSDESLVRAVVVARSESAFRRLYHRHTPRLFRVARRMALNPADAEDAVQETWLRAALQLNEFAWNSALSTWLIGIAINVLREQLARAGRGIDVAIEEIPLTTKPVRETIDLEAAVRELPPGARAVFLLHDVEGFTHEEIAQLLGFTSGTSKTQLHRARQALRRRLADQHPARST